MLSTTSRTVKFALLNNRPYHLNATARRSLLVLLRKPVIPMSSCFSKTGNNIWIIDNIFGRWRQKTLQRNWTWPQSRVCRQHVPLEYWYLSMEPECKGALYRQSYLMLTRRLRYSVTIHHLSYICSFWDTKFLSGQISFSTVKCPGFFHPTCYRAKLQ
jgi:hypothetical protein